MNNEDGGNSLNTAIERMEKCYLEKISRRHEEDKQTALNRQRETYEKQIRDLRLSQQHNNNSDVSVRRHDNEHRFYF